MLFSKVKFDGQKVHLVWHTKSGDDTVKHELESFDLPEQEFADALASLKAPLLDLLGLPSEYADMGLDVTGVTIKHDDERGVGCVVTAQKNLAAAPSPLILNTPYLASGDENFPLPFAIAGTLDDVQAMAARYVQGKRAQGDLFDKEAA